MPGENEIDAQMYFVKHLERRQVGNKFKDFCHYHSKEKTVSSALNRFTSAISSLWKPKEKEKDNENEDDSTDNNIVFE